MGNKGGSSSSKPRQQDKRKTTSSEKRTTVAKQKPYEKQTPSNFTPPTRDELLNAHHPSSRKRKPNADQLVNVQDYQTSARSQLNKSTYEYFSSGSDDQVTLAENQNFYAKIKLVPRVFVNVSNIDTSVSLSTGQKINFPIMVAPISSQEVLNPDGERATARASEAMGTIMCTSTLSSVRLEKTAQESKSLWYQLYILRDREFTKSLIKKVEAAGYKAIVVTVDAPQPGNRESDIRNKSMLPEGVTLSRLLTDLQSETNEIDNSLTWDDLDWIRSITNLPVLVKGVISPLDAVLAYRKKCNGIIVSNHGARQMDTTVSTIEALPAIMQALREEAGTNEIAMDVFIDGGIRRGSDILKAVCLGAKAVFVGRPIAWGLSVNGEQGVKDVLSILKREFELACTLCGITSMKQCNKSFVLLPGQSLQELRSKL